LAARADSDRDLRMAQILDRVRAALMSEPHLDLHQFPIELDCNDGR
jgi:hypothetical protein